MKRTGFAKMQCPIARCLEQVGEWWTLLIVRDAFHGLRRFDEFEQSLGIAPNMLTRRLATLVKAGILEKRRYSQRPPRDEYVMTERGRDLQPVLVAMQVWGNKHFAPEGPSVVLIDATTGAPADPVLVDRATGRPIAHPDFVVKAGPAAGEATRRKLERSAWANTIDRSEVPAVVAPRRRKS